MSVLKFNYSKSREWNIANGIYEMLEELKDADIQNSFFLALVNKADSLRHKARFTYAYRDNLNLQVLEKELKVKGVNLKIDYKTEPKDCSFESYLILGEYTK